jgi:hypothetical protein
MQLKLNALSTMALVVLSGGFATAQDKTAQDPKREPDALH